jgi:hypothetical protein
MHIYVCLCARVCAYVCVCMRTHDVCVRVVNSGQFLKKIQNKDFINMEFFFSGEVKDSVIFTSYTS